LVLVTSIAKQSRANGNVSFGHSPTTNVDNPSSLYAMFLDFTSRQKIQKGCYFSRTGGNLIRDPRVLWYAYFNGKEIRIGNYCNNMNPRMRQGK